MSQAAPPVAASPDAAPVLVAKGLSARYGQVQALEPLDFEVGRGELVAVLGPNGAGKSTLLRAILGLVTTGGEVSFQGSALPRRNPVAVAARGVVLVPEGRGIFGPMSVAENLELGAWNLGGGRSGRVAREQRFARVFELFPRLKERLGQTAGSMSGGEQQMLAIGRALMADPKILLLDEPSLGLAPRVTEEILETLGLLNRSGLPVVLVEQRAPSALKLAHRAYLLSLGRLAAVLDPREVQSHDQLAQYYFA